MYRDYPILDLFQICNKRKQHAKHWVVFILSSLVALNRKRRTHQLLLSIDCNGAWIGFLVNDWQNRKQIIISLKLRYSVLSSLISSSSCRLLWTNSKRKVLLVFQMSYFTFNPRLLNINSINFIDNHFILVVIYTELMLSNLPWLITTPNLFSCSITSFIIISSSIICSSASSSISSSSSCSTIPSPSIFNDLSCPFKYKIYTFESTLWASSSSSESPPSSSSPESAPPLWSKSFQMLKYSFSWWKTQVPISVSHILFVIVVFLFLFTFRIRPIVFLWHHSKYRVNFRPVITIVIFLDIGLHLNRQCIHQV